MATIPLPVRWAILGTGSIARRFAGDMRFSRHGRIVAVGARRPDRAGELASRMPGAVQGGAIDEILAREDVDAVYVATSNASHAALALKAIAAGKPVLVEKPIAVGAQEAAGIAVAAEGAAVLAMEAMWMRFTPGIARLRRLVDAGAIADLRHLAATLSFAHHYEPDAPLFDPHGGGALLDLGVYPVSLALYLLGKPSAVEAVVREAPNGAVLAAALTLRYERADAVLACALDHEGPNEAVVTGTGGFIRTQRPFFCPPALSVKRTGTPASAPAAVPETTIDAGPKFARAPALRQMRSNLRMRHHPTLYAGTGLQYQADHFAECLRAGLVDSPVMPLADSIETLRILDSARRR